MCAGKSPRSSGAPDKIVFTSGGTEANNHVLQGVFIDHRPEKRYFLHASGQGSLYCSVMTWETGTPSIVPILPYPAVVVPVMHVVPIMPPAVQSA